MVRALPNPLLDLRTQIVPILLVLAALLLPDAARAGAIGNPLFLPVLEARPVFADASATFGPQFSSQANGDGSFGDFADLDALVDASASTDVNGGDGTASQTSLFLDDGFSAVGSAEASAFSETGEGLASGGAQTFVELIFQVSSPVFFELTGSLAAATSGSSTDATVTVELLDDAQGDPIVSIEVLPGEVLDLSEVDGRLFPGIDYRLVINALARADAVGPGSATASASFDVDFLLAVPEPSSAALLALGLLFLGARRRR